jgi:hypothetical protein
MEPENTEEKVPERVENLDKEVPPKTNIGGKVWNEQLEAVCCRD